MQYEMHDCFIAGHIICLPVDVDCYLQLKFECLEIVQSYVYGLLVVEVDINPAYYDVR